MTVKESGYESAGNLKVCASYIIARDLCALTKQTNKQASRLKHGKYFCF